METLEKLRNGIEQLPKSRSQRSSFSKRSTSSVLRICATNQPNMAAMSILFSQIPVRKSPMRDPPSPSSQHIHLTTISGFKYEQTVNIQNICTGKPGNEWIYWKFCGESCKGIRCSGLLPSQEKFAIMKSNDYGKQEEEIMIAIACDHGAYALKEAVKKHLEARGLSYKDFGTFSEASCDYPDFVAPAAKAVASGECDRGIVLCTTGIGASITANKVKGIRCALLSDKMSARLTRQHNDTNMMAVGAGVVGPMLAMEIVDTWLDTAFEGGRHQRRIDKVMALEQE